MQAHANALKVGSESLGKERVREREIEREECGSCRADARATGQ